jgi:hypothetical protein
MKLFHYLSVIAQTTGYAHIIRFGMVNRTDTSAIANTIAQGFVNSQYTGGILHNVGIIKVHRSYYTIGGGGTHVKKFSKIFFWK